MPINFRDRFFILFTSGLIILVIFVCVFVLTLPTTEEQLKSLDASRAIPDEENAAFIYMKLIEENLTHPNQISQYQPSNLFHKIRSSKDKQFKDRWDVQYKLTRQPWTPNQYPSDHIWLQQFKAPIEILIRGACIKNYRPPLWDEFKTKEEHKSSTELCSILDCYRDILAMSANVAFGEGKTNKALQQVYTLIKIGQQLQQHPTWFNLYSGEDFEFTGINILNRQLIDDSLKFTDQHLNEIQSHCSPLDFSWNQISSPIYKIESLYKKHEYRKLTLKQRYRQYRYDRDHMTSRQKRLLAYNTSLFHRRCHLLFIQTCKHKNQHGYWPHHLNQIAHQIPNQEMDKILDSVPYFHLTADGSFLLFYPSLDTSKIKNKITPKDIAIIRYNHMPPLPQDQILIDKHIEMLFELHIKNPIQRWHSIWAQNPRTQLIQLSPLSTPMLIKNLSHPILEYRKQAYRILAVLDNPSHKARNPNAPFIPEMIAAFQQEKDKDLKCRYIFDFGTYKHLSLTEHKAINQSLSDTISNSLEHELRCCALKSLFKSSPYQGMNLIFNNPSWLDEEYFGPDKKVLMIYIMDKIAAGENIEDAIDSFDYNYFIFNFDDKSELIAPQIYTTLQQWWQDNVQNLPSTEKPPPDNFSDLQEIYRKEYRIPEHQEMRGQPHPFYGTE